MGIFLADPTIGRSFLRSGRLMLNALIHGEVIAEAHLSARSENFVGSVYHLDGELVPMLTVELMDGQSIFFEHHILLWKHPDIKIGIRPAL
ncbi:hypothetical protein SBF1_2440003 [Candidatus Desulfosporosinus infrequens]|uniref:Uncharacterized protein n=1 Tax=Candidatus Desulfosporosinus infrequens TaxID=2043169 RepID=A0A2U3KNB2_9FIRM|nr:hypothetical protein SBF1_2440003 [Candidatus Desulfosporosinus infrequens]